MPYCEEAGAQNDNLQLNQHAKQRMTPKPPIKSLLPKVWGKIGQWNFRKMLKRFESLQQLDPSVDAGYSGGACENVLQKVKSKDNRSIWRQLSNE